MTDTDIETLARKAYPRRRVCQLHYIEGFKAKAGDRDAARGLVGSIAERSGAAAAIEAGASIQQQLSL